MCQEFCPWGGLTQCMLGYHHPPASRHPPGKSEPPPPQQGDPLTRQTPKQGDSPLARRPPWQGDPPTGKADPPTPCAVHAGRYGQQAGGMHPTGMQSCLTEKLENPICCFHFSIHKFSICKETADNPVCYVQEIRTGGANSNST